MLNPVLLANLLPEHRILYTLKMRLQDEQLRENITKNVRHIRKTHRRNGVNELEERERKFGNNGGRYYERARNEVKKFYSNKSISNNFIGQWRSIEFELIFKSKQAEEEFTHAARNMGLKDVVTIKDDQSIKTNHMLGINSMEGIPHELVISYRAGDEEQVRKFCQCLKGRAYVNSSCGTHFHFDMRAHTEEEVTEFGNRVAQAVPALRLLLPKERRESKFQRQTINTTKTECVYPHKYAFVNLAAFNKHKTMEIRGHSGTINADKILNWIAVIERIMLSPKAHNQVTTIEGLIKTYNLDKHLSDYVKERAARFEDVRTSDAWKTYAPRHNSEEEDKVADKVDVPVHPAFLKPLPAVKQAKVDPNQFFVNAGGWDIPGPGNGL